MEITSLYPVSIHAFTAYLCINLFIQYKMNTSSLCLLTVKALIYPGHGVISSSKSHSTGLAL